MATTDKKSDLSSESVCSILESCAKHGVVELKFRDLSVRFSRLTERSSPEVEYVAQTSPVTAMTDKQHEEINRQSLESDELFIREQQLEELKITNPVEFERLVNAGELDEDDAYIDESE